MSWSGVKNNVTFYATKLFNAHKLCVILLVPRQARVGEQGTYALAISTTALRLKVYSFYGNDIGKSLYFDYLPVYSIKYKCVSN